MSLDNLPVEWESVELGQIVQLNPRFQTDDETEVGFMPMAGVPTEFFKPNHYEVKSWKEVKKGYTCFRDGDVLFAKITPCFENSKAAIVQKFPNAIGAGSTEFFVLHPYADNTIEPFYLYSLVKTVDFLKNGAVNMTGSVGHKRVPKDFVETYNLPLPPLAEQQEIVRQLNLMLAQVEQIKARLDAIPAILKKFRQSVLADAVSGKLTEEWRGNSDINNWQNKVLGDIATVKTGKTPSRKESKYWENASIPWLTSSATGNSFADNADEFISEIASKECNLIPFPKGTLLLAMYGEGKTRGQVTELLIEATCNQACAAILVNHDVAHTSFVKIRLLENYENIRKAASGGNQPNLNLNKVREIDIFLPPLDEQIEIVNIVKNLFVYAEKIEQTFQTAQKRVNLLTQSILAKAFSGELTAEWREQHQELITGVNSAENLLAKIQAEREANKPVKKTRAEKEV